MPLVGILMGGFNFAGWKIHIPTFIGKGAGVDIGIGSFIQNIIDFLIIAASIFLFVKLINKVAKLPAAPATSVEDKKIAKAENEELKVLKEIRDKLK
jgi:large conductance mechanosensitive channel